MNIGYLLQIVNERISDIEALKYIDRNWGQLDLETPAVKFPCAITDIEGVEYADLLNREQVADVEFTVTIAVQNFYNTSQKAPNKAKGYDIFDIIGEVNDLLQGYATPEFATFSRRRLQKVDAEKNFSIYTLTYHTITRSRTDINKVPAPAVKLNINPSNS